MSAARVGKVMDEESIRMPFLLSYPRRLAAGRTYDGIVTNSEGAVPR